MLFLPYVYSIFFLHAYMYGHGGHCRQRSLNGDRLDLNHLLGMNATKWIAEITVCSTLRQDLILALSVDAMTAYLPGTVPRGR